MSKTPFPDSYWVLPGLLLAGEYPYAKEPAAGEQKLAALLDVGIRLSIDLTEAGEYNLRPYALAFLAQAQKRQLQVLHQRFPIPDGGIPSLAQMQAILARIDQALADSTPAFVHCFGGIGRTGTVIGCYLVQHGYSPAQALTQIAAWRAGTPDEHRPAPETAAQVQFVQAWPPGD